MIATRKGIVMKKKYKPVAKKVKPVVTKLPSKYRIEQNIIGDPLEEMPSLDPNPLSFVPGTCYTDNRREALRKLHKDFLSPAELDFLNDFMLKHETPFAWSVKERGKFRTDFFPPVEIPVIPHMPWVERNIPIPPGIYDESVKLSRKKLIQAFMKIQIPHTDPVGSV